MKRACILLCVLHMIRSVTNGQTGASCATAIPILLDSVLRTYTISSSTGSNLICTSSGTTPITYFTITSNSSAQSMLLDITGSGGQPIEVGFYNGVTCNNGAFESASSICLYDGTGLWAPSENFVITPNQTYTLRIKTAATGTLTIRGYYNTPPNNSCTTAMPIGTILSFDNNAAHKPATGISPAAVCAVNLTNTALYTYTVDYTGPTSISLESLVCDNNYQNDGNNLGFQVGIFKGSCAGLTNVACYIAVPGTAQFSAGTQLAGTQMYVAINGILSSNCDYGIRAINALILSATLKYFSAWKSTEGNILKWVSLKEFDNKLFEVQRSIDGVNYSTIALLAGQINSRSEKSYQYTDVSPPDHCLYRLKMVSTGEKISYSNIVRVSRNDNLNAKILFNNKVTDQIDLRIIDLHLDKLSLKLIDNNGRTIRSQSIKINAGENLLNINTRSISPGIYYLILAGDNYYKSFPLMKS